MIVTILISTLSPIFGASKTFAIVNGNSKDGNTQSANNGTGKDMGEVFPREAGDGQINTSENLITSGDYIISRSSIDISPGSTSSGSEWQPTSDTMKFNVTIKLREDFIPPLDLKNDGYFADGDFGGDWETIYGPALTKTSENGMFFFLQKKSGDKYIPASFTLITPRGITSDYFPVADATLSHLSGYLNNAAAIALGPAALVTSLFYDPNKIEIKNAINIGAILFFKDIDQIFNPSNRSFTFTVAVKNLIPGTTYRYGILLKEDAQFDNAITLDKNDIFTTLAVGSPDPNNEPITDSSFQTQGSTETNNATDVGRSTIMGKDVECGLISDFTGCLVIAYHTLFYLPSAFIMRMSAMLMDIFMAYSLSSFMYGDGNPFIKTGWTLVRDISNIFFIFILLWTAFKMVIGDHHFNANKVIVNIIIIGLLINFSLFFTKVIIDLGNITARVFYNQIRTTYTFQGEVKDDAEKSVDSDKLGIKPIPISEAIVNGMSFGALEKQGFEKFTGEKGKGYGVIFLLLTINIVLYLAAAFIFFKVSFAFLGRILSLWMAMIFSPFAFTSTIMDGGHGNPLDIDKIGWTGWFKNLTSAAFYPALFLFFLLLIMLLVAGDSTHQGFLQSTFQANDNLSGTAFIVTLLMYSLFILGLLKVAGDYGQKMAGTFGGVVADLAGKAAGFVGGAAIGLATGGMALGGSKIFGSLANQQLNGEKGEALRKTATSSLDELRASNSGKTDAQLLAMQQKAKNKLLKLDERRNKSYDFRQTALGGALSNATGLNFNAGLSGTKLGVDSRAGGWQASKDRKAWKEHEREEKFKKLLGDKGHVAEDEKKAETLRDDLSRLEAEKKNDSDPTKGSNGLPQGLTELEKELKNIEKAIRDEKDQFGNATQASVDKRKDIEAAIKSRESHIETKIGVDSKKVNKELADLEKNIANNKNGYVKDYMRNKVYENLNEFNVVARRNFLDSIRRGAITGGTVGLAAGVPGAIVGSIAGAVSGGILSGLRSGFRDAERNFRFTDFSGELSRSSAVHDVAAGHAHQPHSHANYHTPHGSWFSNMFNNMNTGGGGGGGGHSSGGHDNHGGGGHH